MIELGQRYKDTVTGFEGTAVGIYHKLHGSSSAEIAADFVAGQPASQPQWFDEERLKKVPDAE